MDRKSTKLPLSILLYSTFVFIIGFIIFLVLYFLNFVTFSLAMGWILGALISSFNYGTILFQSRRLQARIEANIKTPYVSQGYALARLIFSGVGMLICVLFKPNNVEFFNLFSLFGAYLVISLIIFVTGAQYKARAN